MPEAFVKHYRRFAFHARGVPSPYLKPGAPLHLCHPSTADALCPSMDASRVATVAERGACEGPATPPLAESIGPMGRRCPQMRKPSRLGLSRDAVRSDRNRPLQGDVLVLIDHHRRQPVWKVLGGVTCQVSQSLPKMASMGNLLLLRPAAGMVFGPCPGDVHGGATAALGPGRPMASCFTPEDHD